MPRLARAWPVLHCPRPPMPPVHPVRRRLQGTNASPLRKALNDSSLGSAMLGGGMDDELKQPIFR